MSDDIRGVRQAPTVFPDLCRDPGADLLAVVEPPRPLSSSVDRFNRIVVLKG